MNHIEEKYGLKPRHAVALFVIFILNVICIICSTITSIKMYGSLSLNQVLSIVMFIATVYYACYAYKKPHGNHMRYLLLCFVSYSAFKNITSNYEYPTYINVANYVVIILLAYMAGRLDHYKQNVIIGVVVSACKCLMVYYLITTNASSSNPFSFVTLIYTIGPVIAWLAIFGAYITRYKLHKDVGFEDKK